MKLSERFNLIKAALLPFNVPTTPSFISDDDLEKRAVGSDPLSDWFLQLPDKVTPKQISSILRQATSGTIWMQWQLYQKMLDTWPMFKKCSIELRSAIAQSNFVVHPYCEPGEQPTDIAKQKADLVRRALENFRPSRFQDEDGFCGMIFDITDAILMGISIIELIWNEDAHDPAGNLEKQIRASAWVHPRHYAFQPDGSVAVAPSEKTSWISFPVQRGGVVPILNNESKFIVAKYKSKSGTCLSAGLMRPLSYYWSTLVYARDFAMSHAQTWGNPFLDIPYQAGIPEPEILKFERLAKRAAAQKYCAHPNTGEIKVTPVQGMGNDNPQLQMIRMADEACQMLLLGQTLTSSAPKQGGTRAQGDVHNEVRGEKIEEMGEWVAELLTEQLAESLLIENYGESSERPTVALDNAKPLDALEQAQYIQAISTSTVPLPVDDTYKKLGIAAPSPGDAVIVGGKLGVLGDTQTEIDPNPQPPLPGQMFDENGDAMPPQPDQPPTQASRAIRRLLVKATPTEIEELKVLVVKAKNAPHQNGEFTAVRNCLNRIAKR